jgi:hypothetical protein
VTAVTVLTLTDPRGLFGGVTIACTGGAASLEYSVHGTGIDGAAHNVPVTTIGVSGTVQNFFLPTMVGTPAICNNVVILLQIAAAGLATFKLTYSEPKTSVSVVAGVGFSVNSQ